MVFVESYTYPGEAGTKQFIIRQTFHKSLLLQKKSGKLNSYAGHQCFKIIFTDEPFRGKYGLQIRE